MLTLITTVVYIYIMKATHWGEYVRAKRLEKEFTLRGFCKLVGLDPANWSKIENGIAGPPKDKYILGQIINHLELSSLEAFRFWILYSFYDVPKTKSVYDKLPILVSGKKEYELMQLFELIKNS